MSRRIRTIKPEILDDEVSAHLSDGAWRLWVSMWTLSDDAGRLRGSAAWLRGQVFWAHPKVDDEETERRLQELETARVIVRYQVGTQTYAQVRTWTKHQRIEKPQESKIPESSQLSSGNAPLLLPEHSRTDLDLDLDLEGKGSITLKLFPNEPKPEISLAEIYALFPRKEGKSKGLTKLQTTVKTQEDFARCLRAVTNYAASRVGEDPAFTKHFSTWATCWEDYVDFKPPARLPAVSNGPPRKEPPKYRNAKDVVREREEYEVERRRKRDEDIARGEWKDQDGVA